jgi:pimeloyl-ACP methyl ester carboxylesterase
MRRWVVPAVAVLVIVAMVAVVLGIALRAADDSLAGDPPSGPTTPPASSGSEAADPSVVAPPDPALAGFYGQTLTWESCRDGFECSSLEVPIDYQRPDGDTFDLALLRVPAADPGARIGSLVVNPGGPGAPGTSYAAAAGQVFRQPLLDSFDIVGFDPRGTGASNPVDCLTDDELDAYLAEDPDPDTAAEGEAFAEWTRRLGQGCVDRSGSIIAHVSTIEAARDMDVLRAALGEEQLTYFGASYGTKLGATYADLFPERVGRLVLDGAVDVSLSSRELSLGQARGFETALRAYVDNCVEETESCFLGDTTDEGLQRIREFLDDVDQQPIPTGSDRELTEGLALYGLIAPLYNRDYWFLLSTALRQGFEGDGSALLQLADLYASRDAGGYTDNSMEAFYAISCLDDPTSIPAAEVPASYADFQEASPTLGRFFAWGLTGCSGAKATTSERPRDIRAAGAAPIVVVGTTRDPATPYAWAEALADELASGVLVSRDGDGHTGYNSGNQCVDEAIEDYLTSGVAPLDGLSC